jgi:hypothetical protein
MPFRYESTSLSFFARCSKPLLGALAALGVGCSAPGALPSEETAPPEETATIGLGAGESAAGTIPTGMADRVTMGLFEDHYDTWMTDSGVPWDIRYRYVTTGWIDNYGFGTGPNGCYAFQYFKDSWDRGFTPALAYYDIVSAPGGDEQALLSKLQNTATMTDYYNDFKTLMDRVHDWGRPVILLIEADQVGFLQNMTGGNSNEYASVADTGIPELADLPNTVAGWGLSFLKLRNTQQASNAILGIHISAWATTDISYGDTGTNLGPEVDNHYNFLRPFGLDNNNVTGSSYDVLVGDPLDRDSDYYVIFRNQNRWWDPSDGASVNSQSFNRYNEWLRLWNQKTGKRWILWQIPLGNSQHLNTCNNGGPAEGFRDNRAEYFLGNGTAHIEKFANSGVISLLFGAGATCQSSYANDIYNGQPFMQSHAGPLLSSGGVPINAGSGYQSFTGDLIVDSCVGEEPAHPPPPPPLIPVDTFRFGFETGSEGWTLLEGPADLWGVSASPAFWGKQSFGIHFAVADAGNVRVGVPKALVTKGSSVAFRVWVPADMPLATVTPYMGENNLTDYRWTSESVLGTEVLRDQWHEIVVTLPDDGGVPLLELGVQFGVNMPWTGNVYIDEVVWPADMANPDTNPDGGVPSGDAGVAADGGIVSSGGATGNTGGAGGGGKKNKADKDDGGGCSCRVVSRNNHGLSDVLGLGLGVLVLAARRRRRVI